ncbi:Bifunctional inhibitor/lipid-transfer protein/seed storage 2S albumin protein [Dioscorea alata]|uniref:Bifunctional inhibitor/lipid-transfer protein/seed storage 2S albumin protein n=1 Tax=Dioscorea alata TaxID=55571 RepID=A0ACB7U3F7_DIOAL|nr:Bifunctional inhibitor/lipid-transfer protein/seed storage 2S albumin protein [Dioscorea alata]
MASSSSSTTTKLLSMVALLLLFSAKLTVPYPSNPYCLPQYAHANWACYSVLFDKPSNGPSSDDHVAVSVEHLSVKSTPSGSVDAMTSRRNRRHGRTDRVNDDDDDDDDKRGDDECCHALERVDNECVCDALTKLPLFLTVAEHDYRIKVRSSCNVTFECGMHGEMHRG